MTREEATIQALQGHIESLNETIEKQHKYISKLEQKPILNKIRDEIAEYGSIKVVYAITEDTKTDKGLEKLVSGVVEQGKEQVLDIIDKYTTDKKSTCGGCKEWGTVNCPETYREPTKDDDICEFFNAGSEG